MATTPAGAYDHKRGTILLNRAAYWMSRHWFSVLILSAGLWVTLPWLAPLFMHVGWQSAAKAIYFLYSFQCHQLPQRSFFLFGAQSSYSLEHIQAIWNSTADPMILRRFIGDAAMGYKVAWSDRMVSAYTSIPLAALLWWPFRKRQRPLSLWAFILFLLPMGIDGGTHLISDLAGIGQGFRYTNEWLAELTHHTMSSTFYVGDAIGSFNSWMRLMTGVLFGIGVSFFVFPLLNSGFEETAAAISAKFKRAGVDL